MGQFNVMLDTDLHRELKASAARAGIPLNTHIVKTLEASLPGYVSEAERKHRARLDEVERKNREASEVLRRAEERKASRRKK